MFTVQEIRVSGTNHQIQLFNAAACIPHILHLILNDASVTTNSNRSGCKCSYYTYAIFFHYLYFFYWCFLSLPQCVFMQTIFILL